MPDEQPPEAAVIDLDEARVKLADTPLRSKPSDYCGHKFADIDRNKRTLTCRKCGAYLDPFNFLNGLAHEYDLYAVPLARVQKQLDETSAKLEETKRQERNARARLKRLQAKLPGVDE
jgi:hypothetical protein